MKRLFRIDRYRKRDRGKGRKSIKMCLPKESEQDIASSVMPRNCAHSDARTLSPRRRTAFCRLLSLSSFVLAFHGDLTAQLCVPLKSLGKQIEFSAVFGSPQHGPTSGFNAGFNADDMLILSDASLHELSPPTLVNTSSFPGRALSNAMIGDTLWIGTTAGAVRFSPAESDVSIEFIDRPDRNVATQTSKPMIDNISTAFDTVLLSSSTGVYRYDSANSRYRATRTSLPPGRAFGHDPYWWVTRTGVYLLSKDLSLSRLVWRQAPGKVDAVVTARYLWLTSQAGDLVAISKTGSVTIVSDVSGNVMTITTEQRVDNGDIADIVWVATDSALWRVRSAGLADAPAHLEAKIEIQDGGVRTLFILRDHLFFSKCSGPPRECSPTLFDRTLVKGQLVPGDKEIRVADAISDISDSWVLDKARDVLYVPTATQLVSYRLATRTSTPVYEQPTRFVGTWGQHLLLGSALPGQLPSVVPGGNAPNEGGNRFANLCLFEPDATVSLRIEGAELFDWYVELLGVRLLVGGTARILPTAAHRDKKAITGELADLEVCSGLCKKEESWEHFHRLRGDTVWFGSQTLDYLVRNKTTGENFPAHARLFVISQRGLWSVLLVVFLFVLVFVSGKSDSKLGQSARRLLFRTLPDYKWVEWFNIPVAVVTSMESGLWWFVQPMLRQVSGNNIETTSADSEVATATSEASAQETALVMYEALREEVGDRAAAICGLIGSKEFTNDWGWRLPLVVRLSELPDGDIKKTLVQRLHQFSLDNEMLASRLLRSGRMVYILIGADGLKEKAAVASVLQYVRLQNSRSVVVGNILPDWCGATVGKSIQSAQRKKLLGG